LIPRVLLQMEDVPVEIKHVWYVLDETELSWFDLTASKIFITFPDGEGR